MSGIVVVLDEGGATSLARFALAAKPPWTRHGSWVSEDRAVSMEGSASARLVGGAVDLVPPETVYLAGMALRYGFALNVRADLRGFDFTLPEACADLGGGLSFCLPEMPVRFPEVDLPVGYDGQLAFDAGFGIEIMQKDAGAPSARWCVDLVIQEVPTLALDGVAALLLSAIGGAAAIAVLSQIPFLQPYAVGLAAAIATAIGIAAMTGYLGTLLTPFVKGLRIPEVYALPRRLRIAEASSDVDPPVDLEVRRLTGKLVADQRIGGNGEDELIIEVSLGVPGA